MKYDTEQLLSDIRALLVAKLNTKIAAIEAEKIAAGAPNTGLLAVAAYVEQNWADVNFTINPTMFYGIEDMQSNGIGPASSMTYKIWAEVILVDSGMDVLGKNRIHRYARAVREVFEENYDRLPIGGKILIQSVVPLSFKLDANSSETIKSGGVSLTFAIA
jgi:hypothetical protein